MDDDDDYLDSLRRERRLPLRDLREEQKGETFDRRHMSTHAHVYLTSSQTL
jgi:hypothetical protein